MLINYLKKNWLDNIINGVVLVLLFNVIDNYVNTRTIPFVDLITFLSIILVLIFTGWIKKYFQKTKRVSFIDKDFKVNRKGVVFTLGISSHLPSSAQRMVINTLKPELFGFLTTKDVEVNRNVVETIVSDEKIVVDNYKKKEVDPTNIKEIKDSVSHILEWMLKKIHRDYIVVDITGGTAVMSCGAFSAAEEYGVDVQYIFSDYDFEKNKRIPDTEEALIVSQKIMPVKH